MKIRILDAHEMGVDEYLKNGDVVEVVETAGGYWMEEFHYLFFDTWRDKYYEIVQDNSNQLLEEWEMQKQHVWENGDVAIIQDNVCDTHLFEEGQEVILVDAQTTNVNKPAAICRDLNSPSEWWVRHENLSPKPCEINHRTDVNDNSIDNTSVVETPTSDVPTSLVQRIALAHKAALQVCQEAVEAYNTYKELVGELKEDVGGAFKVEEVKWEDMFNIPVTLEELPLEEWEKGDIVECVEEGRTGFTVGNQYTLASIVDNDGDVFVKEDDVGDHYYIQASKLKWISRPQ